MSRKKKITLLIIGIICIISLIAGLSYSYFIVRETQDGENAMTSACFKFEFTDENDINLTNSKPMHEKIAEGLTPYTFTIKNLCNYKMEYSINIETLNNTTMDLNAVRYKLNDEDSIILGSIEDNDSSKFLNENVVSSKTIKTGILGVNASKIFKLNMWIDRDATVEQAAEKTFESKVAVLASLTNNDTSSTTLISGPLLNKAFKELAGVVANEEGYGVGAANRYFAMLGENGEEVYEQLVQEGDSITTICNSYDECKELLEESLSENPETLLIITEDINNYNLEKCDDIYSIEFSNNEPPVNVETKIISTEDSESTVLAWFENNTIYIYSVDDIVNIGENASLMFSGFTNLNSIDFEHLDFSRTKTMRGTFFGTYVNSSMIENIDMSNVTDIDFLFSDSIVDIDDYSVMNTSNVKSMVGLFSDAIIKNGDFGKLKTKNVTTMNDAFSNMKPFTSDALSEHGSSVAVNPVEEEEIKVNFTGIDTSNVVDMSNMFSDNDYIITLDLRDLNTSKVKKMKEMFSNMMNLRTIYLGNFDTSNVTNMTSMFGNSSSLKTIIVENEWTINADIDDSDMFSGARELVGGTGTDYADNYINSDFAKVDCGSSNPGYFTYYEDNKAYCINKYGSPAD